MVKLMDTETDDVFKPNITVSISIKNLKRGLRALISDFKSMNKPIRDRAISNNDQLN